jgi:hypothetical protein
MASTNTRIIPNFTCLLFAILCCLSASILTVTAFNPAHPGSAPTKPAVTETASTTTTTPPPTVPASSPEGATAAVDVSPPVVEGDASAAAPAASTSSPAKQADFGTTIELPSSYASCGQCGAAFALTEEAMGPAKGGRYVELY